VTQGRGGLTKDTTLRRLLATPTIIALGSALVLTVPTPAHAAPPNDFGNGCIATTSMGPSTVVMTSKSAFNPLPITAPITGVITKATFNVPAVPPIQTVIKTLRPTANLNEYTVISQSASFNVNTGNNSYDVRLPVTAGDLLGASSSLAVLLCTTASASDVIGAAAGDVQPGQTATYVPTASRALVAVATVEPDVDKDGYGDTTQDLCPQSAAFQTVCPVIVLDSFAAPSGNSITVVVATNNDATVKVLGTAKVKGKKIKLKGGTKTVKPGALARFKVKIPAALKAALAALPPGKTIKIRLTASATNLVGQVTTDKSSVKVHGTKH
jgi:hypothetical protein